MHLYLREGKTSVVLIVGNIHMLGSYGMYAYVVCITLSYPLYVDCGNRYKEGELRNFLLKVVERT